MKRLIVLFVVLCLSFACAACTQGETEQPHLYYLRTAETIDYGQPDALITSISREIPADTGLDAVLQQYLAGPSEENLRNPFPHGTRLLSTNTQKDTLVIVLSPEFSTLDGIQLTLAGVCLAATCNDFAGMGKIQIHSGEKVYNFDLSSFVFLDSMEGN